MAMGSRRSDTHRAGGGGGGLGGHDGADEHAVLPVTGLIDQRSGLGAAAAEDDGGDGHALGDCQTREQMQGQFLAGAVKRLLG